MTRKALLWPNVLEIQINAFIQVKTLVVFGWLLPLWSRENGISYFNPALCLIQHRACYFYLELDLGFLSRLTPINQWLNLSRVLDAFFHRNSYSMWTSFCSHPGLKKVIATKFRRRHGKCVACPKIYSNLNIRNGMNISQNLDFEWKMFVKWAPLGSKALSKIALDMLARSNALNCFYKSVIVTDTNYVCTCTRYHYGFWQW